MCNLECLHVTTSSFKSWKGSTKCSPEKPHFSRDIFFTVHRDLPNSARLGTINQSINHTRTHARTHAHTHKQLFNGLLSRTTRVCCYQKKHSPTHTHPDHQTSFIIFLHPTIHGILFVQFMSLTVLSDNISPINQSIKNFRTGPSNRSRVFGLVKVIKQNADPFTLVI